MRKLCLIALTVIGWLSAVSQKIYSNMEVKTDASFRGLSVVDDNVAWVSGTKGTVGISIDGGMKWIFRNVAGHEGSDFRSIYAFDGKTAVIANAGSPAVIMRTIDGGNTWTEVYRNNDTAAFIDGIDFWNNYEGMAYGDPIGGKMLLLHTADGGKSWQEVPEPARPKLEAGEVSFAASGTNIHCTGTSSMIIATGGRVSRLWFAIPHSEGWGAKNTPIIQGEATTGIFSFAFVDALHGIIVGGDYKQPDLKVNHVFFTEDGGANWIPPLNATGGYRECVEYLNGNTAIATGPTGTDITQDGGSNWRRLSGEGFHVARKARKGNLVLLAGANGKIAVLKK